MIGSDRFFRCLVRLVCAVSCYGAVKRFGVSFFATCGRNVLFNTVSVTSSFTYVNIQIQIAVLFLENDAKVAAQEACSYGIHQ